MRQSLPFHSIFSHNVASQVHSFIAGFNHPAIIAQTAIAQVSTKACEGIHLTPHYLERLKAQKKRLIQQFVNRAEKS